MNGIQYSKYHTFTEYRLLKDGKLKINFMEKTPSFNKNGINKKLSAAACIKAN